MSRSASVWVVAMLALAGCRSSVDPDQGRFSCVTDADCGAGFGCHQQVTGGGRCFKPTECAATERCNGIDDTCDGEVDEAVDGVGAACTTGKPGRCALGTKLCAVDGGVSAVECRASLQPQAELCNTLDDDCDGQVDEDFDLLTDAANCGQCGHACASGSACRAGACLETNCGDGLDNDGDGGVDCADPACVSLDCEGDGGFNCGRRPFDGGQPDAGDGGALDGGPGGAGDDAGALDGGALDGGAGDGGLDAGPAATVPACVPRELQCGDGQDDDGDGLTDCADLDCAARPCAAGKTCVAGQCS